MQTPSNSRLDPACLWLTLVAGFGFANIALFYGLSSYLAKLGLDSQWQGLLFAAEPLAALILRPWLGVWIKPHRAVPTARIALAVMAVVLLGYGFIESLAGLFALRLIHGVVFVCLVSSVTIKITQHITKEQSARAFYMFSLASLVPFAVVPVLAEWFMRFVPSEASLYGWSSLLCLPALVCLMFVPKGERAHDFHGKPALTVRSMLAQVRGPILYVALANGMVLLGISLVYCFLKPVLAQYGMADPGLFFLLSSLASLVARLKGTWLQAKLSMLGLVVAALGALALTQLGLGSAPGVGLLMLLAVAYGSFQGLAVPLLSALMFNHSPKEMAGVNSNLMLWAMDAAYVAGPVLGGLIYPAGVMYLFASSALCSVFSMLLCLRVGLRPQAAEPALAKQG